MIEVDTAERQISVGGSSYSCRIGRAGAIEASEKREGDGRTPLGDWSIRGALLRPGRGYRLPSRLPWRWISRHDGWCDDPAAFDYNRPVALPYPGSAERMWRDDGVYDVVFVLGYNDEPTIAGRGSAIFLHLVGEGDTEGCVAVAPTVASIISGVADTDSIVRIR